MVAIHSSELLGPVCVRFNDYIGMAVADDANSLLQSKSINQLADLDRDSWAIVGFELFHSGNRDRLIVYATDPQALAICDENLMAPLPVVAFEAPDPHRTKSFIDEAFQEIRVRLMSQRMSTRVLQVTERRQLTGAETPTREREVDPSADRILSPQHYP